MFGLTERAKKAFVDHVVTVKGLCKGGKNGADWHNGMTETKNGKPRSWAAYQTHCANTLRLFAPVATLDETVKTADEAT